MYSYKYMWIHIYIYDNNITVCVVPTTVEPVMAQSLSPTQAKKVPSEDSVRVPDVGFGQTLGTGWSGNGGYHEKAIFIQTIYPLVI
jgi:hypothetical protein